MHDLTRAWNPKESSSLLGSSARGLGSQSEPKGRCILWTKYYVMLTSFGLEHIPHCSRQAQAGIIAKQLLTL